MTFKQTLLAGFAAVSLAMVSAPAAMAQTAANDASAAATVSIEQAIKGAKSALSGDVKLVSADFFDAEEGEGAAYLITFAKGDQIVSAFVDGVSGRTLETESETVTDPVEALELKQEIAKASLSVQDVLAKAPAGQIMSVSLEATSQSVLYNIVTQEGSKIHYALVDAQTGTVLDQGLLPALPNLDDEDEDYGSYMGHEGERYHDDEEGDDDDYSFWGDDEDDDDHYDRGGRDEGRRGSHRD